MPVNICNEMNMNTDKQRRISVRTRSLPPVLIIDNSSKNIEEITKLLADHPYSVLSASDCNSGFEMALELKPKFIILSVDIPQGFYFCGKFRQDKSLKKIPLIITSSKTSIKTFQEHMKLPTHANSYLLRPFSKNQFFIALSEAIMEDALNVEEVVEQTDTEKRKIKHEPDDVSRDMILSFENDEVTTLKKTVAQLVEEREKLTGKLKEFGVTTGKIRIVPPRAEEFEEIDEESDKTPVDSILKKELPRDKIKELEKEIERLKAENKAFAEEKENQIDLFSQLESGFKEQIDLVKTENEELVRKLNESSQNFLRTEQQLKESQKNNELKDKEIKELKHKIEKISGIEKEVSKLPALYQELAHAKEIAKDLEMEINKLRSQSSEIADLRKKTQKVEKLETIEKELENLRAVKLEYEKIKGEMENLQKEKDDSQKAIKNYDDRIEELKERIKEQNKIINTIRSIVGAA
jgi:CheY-like chemotaxis protein